MSFIPTKEQEACVDAAVASQDNLIINALAGAAKTSTLELIAKALPSTPILYLVFNRRNQEEAQKRLASHVKCQTFNGCGHGVWTAALGRRAVLEADKIYKLTRAYGDELPKGSKKNDFFDTFKETLDLIKGARTAGYVPDGKYPDARRLCSLEDFLEGLDFEPEASQIDALNAVLHKSIQAAYAAHIDFDDQIYMPTLFGGTFPRFPLVMADEAQDLSPLNHAMLERLVTKRLIIVGDPWQSIYGFRGAVQSGMAQLERQFHMRSLTLSTSFRCPRAVIRRAQAHVPHMTWPEWAQEGEVHELEKWNAADIPDGAAVICRNNAPLFRLGLELIKRRRGVKIIGADIGPALVRVLKKLGEVSMAREAVLQAITAWGLRQKKTAALEDKLACLRIFANEGETLTEAIAYAEHLFKQAGPITLLTGHKSKGLEFDTVYFLDPWRCGEGDQEQNLAYVITTRAKRALYLVDSDNLI